MSVRSIALILGTAVAFAACTGGPPNTIPLHTAAGPVAICDDALASGVLRNNRPNGLALEASNGDAIVVLWPFGYRSRGLVGNMELVDPSGATVAREGEFVQMAGGTNADGVFVACAGTIKAAPPRG